MDYTAIRVEEHEKQLEEYTRIVDYTNKVLDSITDVHNISENNVYDLIYAKKLLSDAKDVTDVGVDKAIKDTLNRISLIIDLVRDEDITDSIDKKQYDIIDGSKYSKGSALKSLEDASKPKYKTTSAAEVYVKAEIPKFIEILLIVLAIKAMPFILNALAGTNVNESASEVFNTLYGTVLALFNIIATLLIALKLFGIAIDTLYLKVPAMRYLIESLADNKVDSGIKSFISNEALEAIKLDGTQHFVGYEESQKYNRISLAETMYNNMVNDKDFYELRKGTLDDLAVKPESKKANIERLVKVECLYNYYRDWRK